MKKSLLTILLSANALAGSFAQALIYDNGPIYDLAGGGSGGANVSSLHDGLSTYGAGHAASSGFRVAEDISIPAGSEWTIDTLVFYAYQTNSGNTSTITDVNVRIWNGTPGGTSAIVFGDSTTNRLLGTEWTGTYRTGDVTSTTCVPATCVARPIMRNAVYIGTTLSAGTYWIDWQTGGTVASGPWAPPINLGAGNTTTGNAKQYDNAATDAAGAANPNYRTWVDLMDGGTATASGLPFQVIGSVTVTGLEDISHNGDVTLFPNPVVTKATVSYSGDLMSGKSISFKVFDLVGNIVREIEGPSTGSFIFDRSGLMNGVYSYEIKSENGLIRNGKMILQ